MAFSKKGNNTLNHLANKEYTINYNNLFLKTGNPKIENFNFLKRFGTLSNL